MINYKLRILQKLLIFKRQAIQAQHYNNKI